MQVNISYQTLHLPPPYAYAYTLFLDFEREHLKVNFELEYLNRDELNDEEILDEGYSLEDKFNWTGLLDHAWNEALETPIANAPLQKETEEEINTWIFFDIINQKSGMVTNPDEWEYRLQELIQAIYEKSGLEKPLKMKFIDRVNGKGTYYELTGSFSTRSCTINNKLISWQRMQTLMNEVFSMEFEEEWVVKPEEDGLWIDPDGASGYQGVHQMASKKAEIIKKNILKILQSAH